MQFTFSLEEIRRLVGDCQVEGTGVSTIQGIASLQEAESGDLSFLGNKKYTAEVAGTRASVLLLPIDYKGQPRADQVFLRVENPSLALARLCAAIESRLWPRPAAGVHPTAVIDESARIGEGVHIGPHCVIGADTVIGDQVVLQARAYIGSKVVIGRETWVHPGVTVYDHCLVGERVRLHPGCVIGSEGFGFETINGRHEKVPQIGNVVVENDVEIGSNSTIDRARFSSTRIGEGTKIDNLVQIGHNVVIGKHCLLISQVGVSGSTILEDYVVLAGQAGITGHLRLGKGTVVGAQCGLHYNTKPGTYHRSSPALEASIANRVDVLRKRLPELFKRVGAIEKQLGAQSES